MAKIDANQLELEEKIVYVNRVAKVVKGGRRFSLSVLVAVGDAQGYVGVGLGKGAEVSIAVKKAVQEAKKNLLKVPLAESTVPHEIIGRFGAARVLLRPAAPGTGIIAGGSVRAVLGLAGVKDILAKSLGSSNAINVARATMAGLENLKQPKGPTSEPKQKKEEPAEKREEKEKTEEQKSKIEERESQPPKVEGNSSKEALREQK